MAVRNPAAVQQLSGSEVRTESRPGRIGPINLWVKQTGERSAGNPHAAFDVAGTGNLAWSRCCDTRRRKGETTGNPNVDLNRRASPRPYRREGGTRQSDLPTPTLPVRHPHACSVVATTVAMRFSKNLSFGSLLEVGTVTLQGLPPHEEPAVTSILVPGGRFHRNYNSKFVADRSAFQRTPHPFRMLLLENMRLGDRPGRRVWLLAV
jgi:hypothetical protein